MRVALHAARRGTWKWDLSTNVDAGDDSLRRLFGLRPDQKFEIIEDFYAVSPGEHAQVIAAFQRTLHEGVHSGHRVPRCLAGWQRAWAAGSGRGRIRPRREAHVFWPEPASTISQNARKRKGLCEKTKSVCELFSTRKRSGSTSSGRPRAVKRTSVRPSGGGSAAARAPWQQTDIDIGKQFLPVEYSDPSWLFELQFLAAA